MSAQSDKSIIYAGGTDKGKVRQQNEDSILCCDFPHSEVILLVVADGVGGHAGGAVASKLAIESIKEFIGKSVLLAHSGGGYSEHWLESTLLHAIAAANQDILDQQAEQPQYQHMATTLVAVLINQQKVALSHLGDSRCYKYNNNDSIQLTEDHTMLQNLLNEGKIDQEEFEVLPLHHVISQALGLIDEPEIIISLFDFNDNDTFLLCSDGLTNCISDAQIQHVLTASETLEDCVDELITQANDNGGTDNISVVLAKINNLTEG